MRIFQLKRKQIFPITLKESWDFFSNPQNLSVITPPNLAMTVTSELPSKMYTGEIITYDLKVLGGIPYTWVTEITHVEEPYVFIDEQRFGPYRFWHHRHTFHEVAGGVEAMDEVHYALPASFLSPLMNRWLIEGQLKTIFDFRFKVLKEKFGNHSQLEESV